MTADSRRPLRQARRCSLKVDRIIPKILRLQFIIDRRLPFAQLICPGVMIDPYLLKAQQFVNMLRSMILQVRIQNDLPIARGKQLFDQQAQNDPPKSPLLMINLTYFDADLRGTVAYLAIIHLSNRTPAVFYDQRPPFFIAFPGNLSADFIRSRAETVRKSGVRHNPSIIPPIRKLLTVRKSCISNLNTLEINVHCFPRAELRSVGRIIPPPMYGAVNPLLSKREGGTPLRSASFGMLLFCRSELSRPAWPGSTAGG